MTFNMRNFTELKSNKFNEEGLLTVTSRDQIKVENIIEKCFDRFEQLSAMDPGLPHFYRQEHIKCLERSLRFLSSGYECLDASRPWLVYWIFQSAHCLNFKFSPDIVADVIAFLKQCRSPTGGFGGGPMQVPHLAPSYASVLTLCLMETDEAYEAIDMKEIKNFLWSIREPNGAFRMHVDGELDVRGAYCAVVIGRLSGISPNNKLFEGTADWIASCQTYEGGFGGTPYLEAHGGYSFCAAAALALLGNTSKVNLKALLRWAVNRQMKYEGGFQGRTNKLVDGCYSFWQGALVQVTQMLIEKFSCEDGYTINIDELLFNRQALQEYILICCQKPNGGLIDKPGKPEDLYHTCYCLSGLSIAQHFGATKQPFVVGSAENEVNATHPLYNIAPKSVIKAYVYAQNNTKESEDELITVKSENVENEQPQASSSGVKTVETEEDLMMEPETVENP